MTVEQNQKDLETLHNHSARNIESLRARVGSVAVEKAQEMMKKLPVSLGFFHETRPDNLPLIQKSGAIYSFETLKKEKHEHTAGMTYAEKKIDEVFNSVSHAPDPYRQFVYMRPVFNDVLNSMSRTGFLLDNEEISNDVWMSFVDPNQQTSSDMQDLQWGMSVSKSFNNSDVFTGPHMLEAVFLKAMCYMGNAETSARINDIAGDKEFGDFKTYLREFFFEHDSMDYHQTCAYDSYSSYSFRHREKMAEAGITHQNVGVLSDAALAMPDFDELFAQTLTVVFKDVSKWGQVAKLEEVSVKNATVFIHGKPQSDPPASAPAAKSPGL